MKTLTKTEAVDILTRFIKQSLSTYEWFLKIESDVKAMILYGSTAKGTNTPSSDIDLLLIVPIEVEMRYTTGEYFYDFNGKSINIVLRSIERLRQLALTHADPVQAKVFREAQVLWQKDQEVQKLINAIVGTK